MPLGSWWMKQNSQWLSHVRTRSNTADETSMPSGSPGSLRDGHRERLIEPAATDHEVQLGLVHQEAVLDDVTGRATVEREELITGTESGQRGR